MGKKFLCIIAVILTGVTASFGQTVTLSFTGLDAANQPVQLNRVIITDLTKGWSETITWPDTAITIQNGTGIADMEMCHDASLQLSQNSPNPFSGTTDVRLTVAEAGAVSLEITDMSGRIVETQNFASLPIGVNQFCITLSAPGTYAMTARQNGKASSIKMANNVTGKGNRIENKGIVETMFTSSLQLKSHTRDLITHPFDIGDQMEYAGYATINNTECESQHVTQPLESAQNIILQFSETQLNDAQPCPGTPTLTDYDGNVYNTVKIGNQCWMKENLKTTHYANGDTMYEGNTYGGSGWPFYFAPDFNANNIALYGYLYNWKAVMHNSTTSNDNPSGVQGICPNGWHVPSDAEWTELTDYVSSQSQYFCGGDSTYIARALAATTNWSHWNGACVVGNNLADNNATGFSALPAGSYASGAGIVISAWFWSCTTSDNGIYGRAFYYAYPDVYRGEYYNDMGFSVRCLRD